MRHFLPLSLAAAFAFAGCASTSSTWETVRSSRLHFESRGSSEAFAEHLAAELRQKQVPHKVVTYEHRYRTRGGDEAIATRTAVLYRGGSDSRNPWWLMEDRLRAPVWVPGNDPDYQVSFYLRRPATVISIDGRSMHDGKEPLGVEAVAPVTAIARLSPVRRAERSRKYAAVPRARGTGKVPGKYLAIFRARHGSAFDPASVADRLKMERLLNASRGSLARR